MLNGVSHLFRSFRPHFSSCFITFHGISACARTQAAQQTAARDVRAVLVGRLRAEEADDEVQKHHKREGVQEDLIITSFF